MAVSLAQIGEFSFILVTLGRDLGIVPAEAVDIVVATAIISITLNPLAFRTIEPIDRWLARQRPARGRGHDEAAGGRRVLDRSIPMSRAIVVGYGPTGRTVTRLLRENGISPTVVDLNMDVVRAAAR